MTKDAIEQRIANLGLFRLENHKCPFFHTSFPCNSFYAGVTVGVDLFAHGLDVEAFSHPLDRGQDLRNIHSSSYLSLQNLRRFFETGINPLNRILLGEKTRARETCTYQRYLYGNTHTESNTLTSGGSVVYDSDLRRVVFDSYTYASDHTTRTGIKGVRDISASRFAYCNIEPTHDRDFNSWLGSPSSSSVTRQLKFSFTSPCDGLVYVNTADEHWQATLTERRAIGFKAAVSSKPCCWSVGIGEYESGEMAVDFLNMYTDDASTSAYQFEPFYSAFVPVKKGRRYYVFESATNCCAQWALYDKEYTLLHAYMGLANFPIIRMQVTDASPFSIPEAWVESAF